ncbi:AP2/ERF and B3 domain-containing transcription factor [Camellia lanceoleosa]|uniref:AP2/ERF and B3 domain-containing transcription factor n=1 Tax=Camellia lanceoleosa TaxID=1840588 RepID=A0ACC0FKM0_9ERIC|nr:AP2/ERF and B3 domain-containing transcription factor [Camellia lanceoleosa]
MVRYTGEGSEARDLLNDREISCQELFRKKLTPSNVSGLNRLVIPKKYAVVHFPPCNDSGTSGGLLGSHVGLQPDLQCDFEDQDSEDERGGNEMKKGFKLFGVEIKVSSGNGNGV